MSQLNNIENFRGRFDGRGGGSKGNRSTGRYNTRKSTSPIRRQQIYSRSRTLGGTGGGPFWGWNYYPWMRVSYPFYDYAEYPEFIEYAPVDEVKESKKVKEVKEIKEDEKK
jgi:hypothetical protein